MFHNSSWTYYNYIEGLFEQIIWWRDILLSSLKVRYANFHHQYFSRCSRPHPPSRWMRAISVPGLKATNSRMLEPVWDNAHALRQSYKRLNCSNSEQYIIAPRQPSSIPFLTYFISTFYQLRVQYFTNHNSLIEVWQGQGVWYTIIRCDGVHVSILFGPVATTLLKVKSENKAQVDPPTQPVADGVGGATWL